MRPTPDVPLSKKETPVCHSALLTLDPCWRLYYKRSTVIRSAEERESSYPRIQLLRSIMLEYSEASVGFPYNRAELAKQNIDYSTNDSASLAPRKGHTGYLACGHY